jgi:CheY-like chemotaxis protein
MPTKNRPIRALAVDDHPDTAETLARLLQSIGCAATFVTESWKAIDAAEAFEPDVIFLDIGMPGIDGYELARLLRSRYGQALLLVAITAYGSDQHHRSSREAGFDAHVQKPVDLRVLQSVLATVVPGRR